jgi:hypothetical protein
LAYSFEDEIANGKITEGDVAYRLLAGCAYISKHGACFVAVCDALSFALKRCSQAAHMQLVMSAKGVGALQAALRGMGSVGAKFLEVEVWEAGSKQGAIKAVDALLMWLAVHARHLCWLSLQMTCLPSLHLISHLKHLDLYFYQRDHDFLKYAHGWKGLSIGSETPNLQTLCCRGCWLADTLDFTALMELRCVLLECKVRLPECILLPPGCKLHVRLGLGMLERTLDFEHSLGAGITSATSLHAHIYNYKYYNGSCDTPQRVLTMLDFALVRPDWVVLEIQEATHLPERQPAPLILRGGISALEKLFIMSPEASAEASVPQRPLEQGKIPVHVIVPKHFGWRELRMYTTDTLVLQFDDLDAFMERLPACCIWYKQLEGTPLSLLTEKLEERGLSWDAGDWDDGMRYLRAWPAGRERPSLHHVCPCTCGACRECLDRLYGL